MRIELTKLPEYTGPYRDIIPVYIKSRQAMGLSPDWRFACYLRDLDNFAKRQGITKPEITRELYEEYTAPREGEKSRTPEVRRSLIRPFARYLSALGYENIYTGLDDKRVFRSDFIPYVFSSDEIQAVFSLLDNWHIESPNFEDDSFRMAMQLFYCCGLRRSEVLLLKKQDINLVTGKVTILESKNNISRIVVASDSLLNELQHYAQNHVSSVSETEYFIYPGQKRKTVENKLYIKYARLLAAANIHTPNGSIPRIHDLRHTFCVRALEQMEAKGVDIYTSLPMLAVYLGHRRITETEYYLRLMESHFSGILEQVSSYSPNLYKGIAPDTEVHNEE